MKFSDKKMSAKEATRAERQGGENEARGSIEAQKNLRKARQESGRMRQDKRGRR